MSTVQINHIEFSAVRALSTCHAAIDMEILCVSTVAHGTADSFAVMRQAANKIATDKTTDLAVDQVSGYIAGRNIES